MRTLISALAVSLAMLAVGSAYAQTHAADVQAIRDTEAQWNRDYQSKDLDKLAGHYANDAVLMAPFSPPVQGIDAIRSAMKGMVDDPALSLKFHATRVEVAKAGDLGFSEGTYELTLTNPATNKPVNDHGTYVTVYRKQSDGAWKAVSDIASSGAAPGSPQ